MKQGSLIQHRLDKYHHWWFVLAVRGNGTLIVCTQGYFEDIKIVLPWAYKLIHETNKSNVEFAKLFLQKERVQREILKWELGTQMT
jgi:hypothetical protein